MKLKSGNDRRIGRERRKFDDNIMPPDERNGIERREKWREDNIIDSVDSILYEGGGSTELG